MKIQYLVTAAVFVGCLGISGAAKAAMTCEVDGNAACYVDYVELYTADSSSTDTYIVAKISSPYTAVPCTIIKVKKGSQNADLSSIRTAEMILLTAMTTQLPIKFTVNSYCFVKEIAIQKQAY